MKLTETETYVYCSIKGIANGYDLTDPDGRAGFRGALTVSFKIAKVSALRGYALAFGAEKVGTSRNEAIHALAAIFIEGKEGA